MPFGRRQRLLTGATAAAIYTFIYFGQGRARFSQALEVLCLAITGFLISRL